MVRRRLRNGMPWKNPMRHPTAYRDDLRKPIGFLRTPGNDQTGRPSHSNVLGLLRDLIQSLMEGFEARPWPGSCLCLARRSGPDIRDAASLDSIGLVFGPKTYRI